jgi:hypothetical protein
MERSSMAERAWAAAGTYLGAADSPGVLPAAAARVVDDLIYSKLSPSERRQVDALLRHARCASPLVATAPPARISRSAREHAPS